MRMKDATLLGSNGTSIRAEKICHLERFPLASAVVLCRNERQHIAACLDSLLAGDYPGGNFEILVVDGQSDDGTVEVVRRYAEADPRVRLVCNPKRTTPAAMNIGIRAARGQAVAIIGAHATYHPSYLSECVRHLFEYGADQAGAVARYLPGKDTLLARAIAAALHHPFGAGANIAYKNGAKYPIWVDTVSSGCYRREVFDRVGPFNEDLRHSQDIEWNQRLRRAGGRILLVPTAVIEYYVRSDWASFTRHNFRNGAWSILPFAYSDCVPIRARHLVPLAFVAAVLGSLVAAGLTPAGRVLAAVVLGAYAAANLVASLFVAWRERKPSLLLVMPAVFAILHFTYGLGSLLALPRLLVRPEFWRRLGSLRHSAAPGK
jgi:glycosyltransferase involved in cell wall biosynthesis